MGQFEPSKDLTFIEILLDLGKRLKTCMVKYFPLQAGQRMNFLLEVPFLPLVGNASIILRLEAVLPDNRSQMIRRSHLHSEC